MKMSTVIVSEIMMVLAICAGFAWADATDTSYGTGAGIGGTYNTFIGYDAGTLDGDYNTDVGYYAGVSGGTYNASIGYQAGADGGVSNASIGYQAGLKGGTFNASLGYESGYSGGISNTSIGYYAGYSSGNYNTSLGAAAGYSGGTYNTSIGYESGYSGGINNTSLGFEAGFYNQGTGNVFLGYAAGQSETGSNKLYIDNCYLNSDGNCDTPFIKGDFSAQTLTVNGQLTATNGFVGDGSGLTNINAATVTNGVYTSSGYADPAWITALSGSKITGTVASATTATNATTVTNGVYTTGSYSNPAWITSLSGSIIAGTVANATNAVSCTVATYATDATTATTATTCTTTAQIGTNTANYIPRWNGSQLVSGIITDNGSAASVNGTLSVIALVSVSDERYKRNIQPLQQSLDKVTHLTGVSYEWKTDEYSGKGFKKGRQIGLIAQDVEKVFPELVLTDDKGYKAVAYDKLVSVLIEAVKEQQKTIADRSKVVDEQQNAINELKGEMAKLIAEVNKLKNKDMSAQK
ncbi:MAG: tail fiber domain-containing protein [Dissulfurispiraceae bacterium]